MSAAVYQELIALLMVSILGVLNQGYDTLLVKQAGGFEIHG